MGDHNGNCNDRNLTIISEDCLQDLDNLYVDAAAKLRDYDKLCIAKDTIILELVRLD